MPPGRRCLVPLVHELLEERAPVPAEAEVGPAKTWAEVRLESLVQQLVGDKLVAARGCSSALSTLRGTPDPSGGALRRCSFREGELLRREESLDWDGSWTG
jgi:hypothetical protein